MGRFNKQFFINLLAEFLASLLVQFVGCSITAVTTSSIAYSITWGGAVLAATQAFRILSGAHINPCISLAAMVVENTELLEGFLYIFMQFLGSLSGFAISYGLMSPDFAGRTKFCCTLVTIKPWWKSIFLEIYMTATWVLAMCASWSKANESLMETISLRIGIVVTACSLASGGHTGASMNPFRSMWPAIIAHHWEYLYVFILTPVLTALLMSFIWRWVYLLGDTKGEEREKAKAGE